MRRVVGFAGLLMLGIVAHLGVRTILARVPPSNEVAAVVDREGPRMTDAGSSVLEVLEDDSVEARIDRWREAPDTTDASVVGARSIRLDEVINVGNVLMFAGEAKLYQRDPPARFFWVARVRDRVEGEILREWSLVDQEFGIEAGRHEHPFCIDWVEHDLGPGTYVFELTVDSFNDPFDLTSNWKAERPFRVE